LKQSPLLALIKIKFEWARLFKSSTAARADVNQARLRALM